jgi:lambda family phage minor tail protein L
MPTINTLINPELQKLEQGSAWVELFELDATAFGGTIFRFCNHLNTTGGNVVFAGLTYTAMPIEVSGWDLSQTGTSAKPTLSVSNISKVLLSAIISQGDLVGAKLSRIRTFSKFLADGSTPNSTAFIGPDKMIIEQKTFHDRSMIQFQLSSVMDRMGMKLPRRQVLKDPNALGCNFPGVSRSRVR